MSRNKRPLSPFMLGQDYKLQITSLMSFLHRATGVVFVVILLAIGYWLGALASGPKAFARINSFLTHWAFFPFLLIGTCAACYHFCNGIRHLVWDTGYGLTMPQAQKSAKVVQVCTAFLVIALVVTALVA